MNKNDENSRLILANDIVRFEFEAVNGGLAAMIDLETGMNHIQPICAKAEDPTLAVQHNELPPKQMMPAKGKHELWELTFCHGTQKSSLSSTRVPFTSSRIEKLAGGARRVTFEWSRIDWCREEGVITVRVTVDLLADSGIASWRIWVSNRSSIWGLWEVIFPKFNGYLESGGYDVAMPSKGWGTMFRNLSEKLEGEYPNGINMPMQFLCATKGKSSVYMATHDPRSWRKDFLIEPGKQFKVKTYAENMAVPGSDYRDPFPVMVGVYRGGWIEGCKIYRNFAVTAPWTSEGRVSQRMSMPQALKDIGLWFMERELDHYTGSGGIEDKEKPLDKAQEYFDVPLAAHWYRWHTFPFDHAYPHYLPAKHNIPEMARYCVSKGQVISLYINGRIVDTFNDDFGEYRPHACKDQIGELYLEVYNCEQGSSGRMTTMCPYTVFWQDKLTDVVRLLGTEVGVNSVHLDQIGCTNPRFCFDSSHGHPLGGGSWWVDGYRKMLMKFQEAAHNGGNNIFFSTESVCEAYMDGIDCFKMWYGHEPTDIPMLAAVYSGYTLYVGGPCTLVFPKLFDCGDRAWIMMEGRNFLWGIQNGNLTLDLLFKPEHTKKAAYLKKIGKNRIAGKKFLTYGELVGLINHTETVTEYWPSNTWHGEGDTGPRKAVLPIVQGAIWKAEDGSLGIFLVNYLEEESTFEFTIDLEKYGLNTRPYRITRVSPEGSTEIGISSNNKIKRIEKLGPWDICILEICPK